MKRIKDIKVTIKAATTIDGKIATELGHSKWISGKAARYKVHQLRNENDAILVGINTVLLDDPELSVRGIEKGRSPVRIVLDSKARIPEKSRMFKNDGVPVIVIIGNQAPTREWPDLETLKIIEAPTERPEILWVLTELKKLGLRSLLVEGGSLIHASFINSNCTDHVALFVAPIIFGGQSALSWCGDLKVENVKDAIELDIISITPLGKDWFISAKVKK